MGRGPGGVAARAAGGCADDLEVCDRLLLPADERQDRLGEIGRRCGRAGALDHRPHRPAGPHGDGQVVALQRAQARDDQIVEIAREGGEEDGPAGRVEGRVDLGIGEVRVGAAVADLRRLALVALGRELDELVDGVIPDPIGQPEALSAAPIRAVAVDDPFAHEARQDSLRDGLCAGIVASDHR